MNSQLINDDTTINSEDSFAEIVNARQQMVFNTVLGIVQNEEDAEDVTQEVFVKVFERIKEFRGEASISTWIYRIAITTALDFEKQKKRHKRGGLLTRVFGTREADDAPDFFHPGVALDKKEDAAVLFKAIKKLPEKQRTAFLLHKVEGLTNNEIGVIMNISLQAAESLQIRAKNNLRKELQVYYEKHF